AQKNNPAGSAPAGSALAHTSRFDSESADQFFDRGAAVGDLHRAAVLRGMDGVERNSQRVGDGRPDVAGEIRLADAARPVFVGFPDREAALESPAADHY